MIKNIFNKKPSFEFRESKKTACIVCSHVLNHAPILFVSHDKEDSMWQFLCGKEEHDENDAKVISLEEVTVIDNSVNDLYEMPLGFCATRNKATEAWKPFKNED